jgi:hypothetical protein
MDARPIAAFATLALILGGAQAADRAVYKSVDASGSVAYSDRRSGERETRVTNWMPGPGRYAYAEGVQRAASDRAYYARLQYENRQPAPIAVYDPRRWQAQRERAAPSQDYSDPGHAQGYSGRRDYNLPNTPSPSLERNYYFNGR